LQKSESKKVTIINIKDYLCDTESHGFLLLSANNPYAACVMRAAFFTINYPSDYLSFRFQIIFQKVPTFSDSRVYMGESIPDAEDLSQEIAIRAFRALLVKDDVVDMGKFIWTDAHNTLSNYKITKLFSK